MAKLEQGILGPFRGKVGTVVGYLWRGRHVVRGYRREINYPNTENQQAERDWFVSMVRFAATARQALLLGLRERAARDQMTEGNAFVKMNKHCFGRTHAPVAACGGATPSSLEGELKCRDAACRVRKAPANISDCKAPAGIPDRKAAASIPDCGAVADTPERGAVADIPAHGAVADAARCVPTEYERIRISEGAAAPVLFREADISDDGILHVDFEKNSGMSRAKGSDRVYVYVYNSDTREGLLSHPAERRHGRLQMQLPDGWNAQNTKLWGFTIDSEGRASGSAFVEIGDSGNSSNSRYSSNARNSSDSCPSSHHDDASRGGAADADQVGAGGRRVEAHGAVGVAAGG